MEGKPEKLKVVKTNHKLVVDGKTLREIKEVVTYVAAEGSEEPGKTVLTHARWIGDDIYCIREETNERGEVTDHKEFTKLKAPLVAGTDAVQAFLREWDEKWTRCEIADAVPVECQCLRTTACQRRNQGNGLPEDNPDTSDEEDVGELQALAAEAVVYENVACDCEGPKK